MTEAVLPPYHQGKPEDLGGKLGLTRCMVVMALLADFLAYPSSLRPYACKAFQSRAGRWSMNFCTTVFITAPRCHCATFRL